MIALFFFFFMEISGQRNERGTEKNNAHSFPNNIIIGMKFTCSL